MEQLTATGNTINSISQKDIKLDHQIKKVLACKPILAIILSETVEECKGMSCEEIEKCIEGDILVESEPLLPTDFINGNSQEDYQPGEGEIRYDIRTYLKLPNMSKPELSKIIINVEAQKDDTPGYDLPIRGIFYCSRMLSSQLNTEFTVRSDDSRKYQNIKKVYSIWICTNTADKRKNSIEKYSLNKEMLFGKNDDDKRFDLMTAIIVNIGHHYTKENTGSRMLDVLSVLVDESMSSKEKLDLLKTQGVPVTKEIEKEVEVMTSYTANILTQGRAEGRAEGEAKLAKLISSLVRENRNEDIAKASTDEEARKKLYKEFGIID